MKADLGAYNGKIYKNRGLMYVIVVEDRKATTKPIKASAFYNKPTLNYIESKFKDKEQKREPQKKHVRLPLVKPCNPHRKHLELAKHLQKDRIGMVIERNEQGRVYV